MKKQKQRILNDIKDKLNDTDTEPNINNKKIEFTVKEFNYFIQQIETLCNQINSINLPHNENEVKLYKIYPEVTKSLTKTKMIANQLASMVELKVKQNT